MQYIVQYVMQYQIMLYSSSAKVYQIWSNILSMDQNLVHYKPAYEWQNTSPLRYSAIPSGVNPLHEYCNTFFERRRGCLPYLVGEASLLLLLDNVKDHTGNILKALLKEGIS